MSENTIHDSIVQLQRSYLEYMARLKAVLDFGDGNIEPLIAALDHKHANPIAQALGLMMHSPAAERAYPKLLGWLMIQSPLYRDALEALVRAGDKPAGIVFLLIREHAEKGDDEAVRNLFDLACRFSNSVQPQVVTAAVALLDHPIPHLRETAADAIWKIGLPHGLAGKAKLKLLARNDQCEHVRRSATEALERLGDTSSKVDLP